MQSLAMPHDSAATPENSQPSAELAKLIARVTALEELLSHSQHTIEGLSQEMFAQTRRVEAVLQELSRLMHKLNLIGDALPAAQHDPVAEKPPHY
jgi:uncharacterized coiled-coil protein SlyX